MKTWIAMMAVLATCWLAGAAMAAGPHDMECVECHSTHYAKTDYLIGVEPDLQANPARTATPSPVDNLCLGCHNDSQATGINLHASHPTGVRPIGTKVPGDLLWNGVFTCVSCHNPHPSNANYKYLVMDTADGASMGAFCATCHPEQADPDSVAQARQASLNTDKPGSPIVPVSGKTSPAQSSGQPAAQQGGQEAGNPLLQ